MSDDAVETCPDCQGKVVRVLYPTGVVFKGSGYYSTDYKGSGSSASSNGSSASSDGKPESKSETKTDSKPESKQDAGD